MDDARNFDILDCHQHVGGVMGIPGQRSPGSGNELLLEEDKETRLAAMDHLGIRQALLMPAHSYLKPHGIDDTRAINDRLAAYQKLCPDRIPAVFGTVEPRHGMGALAEVDRMRHELGFRGVSWHHRQQGLPMDHPIMYAILRRMSEIDLIPLIHCFIDADFEELWRLRRLAESFPELTFVCLDTMTHPDQFEEALAVGEVVPNVIFDATSSVLGPEGISRFVDKIGVARLLFGSNLYTAQRPNHLAELDAILAAGIPEGAKRLILGGNARRLFNIVNS